MPTTIPESKCDVRVPDGSGAISTPEEHDRLQAEHHSGSIDALLVRALTGRKALLRRIAEWQRRVAGRRELITLTDRDLHDIGIGRSEAEAESNKPFWET
ncbi:MAG: DUF1127 domain-containing protein [Bradyrhizobiaceae bacterium]|nr:DUF1127 domain-containing protein [Bradyrhizobiaceae bacterium]